MRRPRVGEWGYVGRKFFARKIGTPTAAGPFLVEHLKSMKEYPPSQRADTLSMHKAIESTMAKMNAPGGSSD